VKKIRLVLAIIFFSSLFVFTAFAEENAAVVSTAPVEAQAVPHNQPITRPLRTVQTDGYPPSRLSPYLQASSATRPLSLITSSNLAQPLTQRYIKQYSSSGGKQWLKTVMERGAPYIGFIRGEIETRGLPPELLYLPVIESQFLSTAVSRSGATGLWQFMRNSIAPFDMKVNEWIDERRDFWKSTQGALRKLEENYLYFGDWPLALAAYNAGLGAVNRAVKQYGGDYWSLCERKLLKTETVHYVPKLIAVAAILSDPRRYGMDPLWAETPQWTRVPVKRQADLKVLAAEAGIDAAALANANKELSYGVTPPGDYHIKVREEDAEKVRAVLERADIKLVTYYRHQVRSGDTLSALAQHYGVTVDYIAQANPGVEARYLKLGSTLLIPAMKETGPYAPAVRPPSAMNYSGVHLVKKGETLWSLSLAYGIDPETLADANGMDLNGVLREGRELKVPGNRE
jgi:membrane-bound lytic murein transglycosylase D